MSPVFGFTYPEEEFGFLPTGLVRADFLTRTREKAAKQEAINDKVAATRAANRKAKWAAREAAWKRQRELDALALPEKIEKWRAGEQAYLPYDAPTMLRIKGDEVQTSRGASVPVSHAKRGLKFVRGVMASGTEYVRNGHTLHLGHYPIDKVTTDGTLYAGCHVIPWAEIERIAPELDAQVTAGEGEVQADHGIIADTTV